MALIITGTPGTGKTELAKKLSKEMNKKVVNITGLLREKGLDEVWDDNRNCFLVDVVRLTELLEGLVEHDSDVIIEGHLSHHLNPARVDRCIVTKTELPELKRRLEARGYDERKVRENLDCEIFDVCFVEAQEQGHDPEIVWTG